MASSGTLQLLVIQWARRRSDEFADFKVSRFTISATTQSTHESPSSHSGIPDAPYCGGAMVTMRWRSTRTPYLQHQMLAMRHMHGLRDARGPWKMCNGMEPAREAVTLIPIFEGWISNQQPHPRRAERQTVSNGTRVVCTEWRYFIQGVRDSS